MKADFVKFGSSFKLEIAYIYIYGIFMQFGNNGVLLSVGGAGEQRVAQDTHSSAGGCSSAAQQGAQTEAFSTVINFN